MQLWLLSCQIVLPPWVWTLFVRAPYHENMSRALTSEFNGLKEIRERIIEMEEKINNQFIHSSNVLVLCQLPTLPGPSLSRILIVVSRDLLLLLGILDAKISWLLF